MVPSFPSSSVLSSASSCFVSNFPWLSQMARRTPAPEPFRRNFGYPQHDVHQRNEAIRNPRFCSPSDVFRVLVDRAEPLPRMRQSDDKKHRIAFASRQAMPDRYTWKVEGRRYSGQRFRWLEISQPLETTARSSSWRPRGSAPSPRGSPRGIW